MAEDETSKTQPEAPDATDREVGDGSESLPEVPSQTGDSAHPHRRPVFLTDLKVCFLVHQDTHRILCAARYDQFAKKIARLAGCEIVEIRTAHEYDIWARRYCQQRDWETAEDDARYLERENHARKLLRQQLRDRLSVENSGPARRAIDSALQCLDVVERRRQRYRSESFIPQEAFEATKNVGEELLDDVTPPRK